MTKKDYEMIAKAFSYAIENDGISVGLSLAVNCIVIELHKENPRFDSYKFRTACGMTEDSNK